MSSPINRIEIYPSQDVTASMSSGTSQHLESKGHYPIRGISVEEQVEAYFFRDVQRVESGLAIMMLLFPVYERYLRWKKEMPVDEKFSENHRVFRTIAKEIGGMNEQNAYHFWQCCRNCLLHQASVKETMVLLADGPPVEIVDRYCYINPYALRETLIEIFQDKANRRMWKDLGEQLPVVYRKVKP